ncbi:MULTISPECIES: transglycosylase domain-containing protein [Bacillus]|uniref:transglycosylase domain-containing protein n=1 Tax=Bacillus TaxID=1386 RepID=UPI0006806687|nr:transglycosylase domain-containing protein [Bacillus altitudinis]AKU29974.1 penicillin-binding protein [Bacillus altitudinis]MCY7579775.1 penicillin-binding protein [Bacillus altitudinis]MCY7595297.1 penicillin-binding protein [Bacillus altitudinis]MEC1182924.1 transglycosylase domain-containing protein [Bacillus altitudinis]OPW89008.1 penicillin-binding protein [Bacillus altitudinis]
MARNPKKVSDLMFRAIIGWLLLAALIPLFVLTFYLSKEEAASVKPVNEVLDQKIKLEKVDFSQNSYMYDRDGSLISEIVSNDENRVFVKYDKIPDSVKELFLRSEDRNFYDHKGIDFMGVIRALAANVKNHGISQGASTITQQLSRNLYLSHERSFSRKFTELLYSYELERKFTKEEILESYLNTIYFSNGVYGVGSAANYYFDKPLSSLTLAQMAFISAIPNNPTLYDPLKQFKHTKKRQERLLGILEKDGVITKKQYKKAVKEKISLSLSEKKNLYPDYVTYANEEFTDLVSDQEGFTKRLKKAKTAGAKKAIQKELSEKVSALLQDGVKIYTALDPSLQQRAVYQLNAQLPYQGVEGGSAVINHQTHQIVALAGGKNYKKFDFNYAYQAQRQPGSAIKPLLDYGPYIDQTGATASSKISAGKFCSSGYCPQNYSHKTYGTVTLETAFKNSYNTPAIRMLDTVGVKKGFSYLEKFSFEHIVADDYRLPSALGGFTKGFSPLEITDAYTVFGNQGAYTRNHSITKVTDLNGKTLYKWKESPKQIYSQRTNETMRKLLASVVKSGTGKKANFNSPYIGGKTGTSNDYKDIWFVGLTDQYTMGVWVGRDRGTVESIYSSSPHLRIWKQTMQYAR